MSDYRVDERDIRFVLYEQLEVDKKLQEIPDYAEFGKDMYDMVINEAIKFAVNEVAPVNRCGDLEGGRFENGKAYVPSCYHDVYKKYVEGGWIGLVSDPEYGGQGMPETLGVTVSEIFAGASLAFSMYPGLTAEAAKLILHYGSDEMKKIYVPRMLSGEWQGTMCLTEPDAGSDVGNSKTKAIKKDGKYFIEGQKIFISSGDHDMTENHIHLVLARLEGAPPGTKGLSLFLVPKYKVNPDGSLGEFNDVNLVSIEHKMGINGSITATLSFGENGKCEGYLIGEENQGIKYMFLMMNGARIGTGILAMANAAAAYLDALDYAHERKQGSHWTQFKDPTAPRVPIVEHPDVRRMLLQMKATVEGLRSLLYHVGLYSDLAEKHPDEKVREHYQDLLDLLTPIAKAYSSDQAFRVAELAVQTYGGYGYTKEYMVEQYLRDIKITSIYEGANGIQAMDLLFRKMTLHGGRLFMRFMTELNKFIETHQDEEKMKDFISKLAAARDSLVKIAMQYQQDAGSGNFLHLLLTATPYLELFGHVVVGYFMADQARIAIQKLEEIFKEKGADSEDKQKELVKENEEAKFYHNKIQTVKYFLNHALPKVKALEMEISDDDKSPMEVVF